MFFFSFFFLLKEPASEEPRARSPEERVPVFVFVFSLRACACCKTLRAHQYARVVTKTSTTERDAYTRKIEGKGDRGFVVLFVFRKEKNDREFYT